MTAIISGKLYTWRKRKGDLFLYQAFRTFWSCAACVYYSGQRYVNCFFFFLNPWLCGLYLNKAVNSFGRWYFLSLQQLYLEGGRRGSTVIRACAVRSPAVTRPEHRPRHREDRSVTSLTRRPCGQPCWKGAGGSGLLLVRAHLLIGPWFGDSSTRSSPQWLRTLHHQKVERAHTCISWDGWWCRKREFSEFF